MGESREYVTLLKCTDKLQLALLHSSDLIHPLYMSGLIKRELRDELNEPRSMLSQQQKTINLVKGIQDSVKYSSQKYYYFLNILGQRKRDYGDIVNILNKEHGKNSSPSNSGFVCREEEIETLLQSLEYTDNAPRIITITGGPGYGKSTLAIYMGNKLLNENVDVIYINMEEMGDMNSQTYIESKVSKILSRKISLYQWSSSLSQKTLLIIDNLNLLLFAERGNIEIIVSKLIKHSSQMLKILITSREHKYAEKLLVVPELSLPCACQLLCNTAKIVTSENCKKITTIVGGVPLALISTGTLLNMVNSGNLDEFASQLQGNLLEMLNSDQLPPKARVKDSIYQSYKNLRPEVQEVGRLLSYFSEKFARKAAYEITASCIHKLSNDAIDKLVEVSLLNSDGMGWRGEEIGYKLCNYDNITRAFFRSLLTHDEAKTIVSEYLRYYVSFLEKIAKQDNHLFAGTDFLMASRELFHFFDLLLINKDLKTVVDSFVKVAGTVIIHLKENILIKNNEKGEFMLSRLEETRQQLIEQGA